MDGKGEQLAPGATQSPTLKFIRPWNLLIHDLVVGVLLVIRSVLEWSILELVENFMGEASWVSK